MRIKRKWREDGFNFNICSLITFGRQANGMFAFGCPEFFSRLWAVLSYLFIILLSLAQAGEQKANENNFQKKTTHQRSKDV